MMGSEVLSRSREQSLVLVALLSFEKADSYEGRQLQSSFWQCMCVCTVHQRETERKQLQHSLPAMCHNTEHGLFFFNEEPEHSAWRLNEP